MIEREIAKVSKRKAMIPFIVALRVNNRIFVELEIRYNTKASCAIESR